MLTRIVCWLLNNKILSAKDRVLLTNQVLKSIDSLPTRAILTVDKGQIFVQGVPIEGERAYLIREGAEAALHNLALRLVHDQVLYAAVSLGIHQAQNTEQIQFAKAAIWYGQQEIELLQLLSQQGAKNELDV